MDTKLLNRAMREATDDLRPAPDFASRVVRGGRRRALRSRLRITTVAAAVVAVAGGTAVVAWSGTDAEPPVAADWRLAEPTRGDLAGDARLRDDAVRAWRDGLRYSDNGDSVAGRLRGEPHVYWAGSTPAGRAAVVLQAVERQDYPPPQTVVGLVAVDPASNEFRLVADDAPSNADSLPAAFAFGSGDRTLLALDDGEPLYISLASLTAPDGTVSRKWQPMSATNGVALAQLPPEADPDEARVLSHHRHPALRETDTTGAHWITRASGYVERADARRTGEPVAPVNIPDAVVRLPWLDSSAGGPTQVGRPVDLDQRGAFAEAVRAAGMLDPQIKIFGWGTWMVVAGLPDGRTAVVSEIIPDKGPGRVFTVVLDRAGGAAAVIPLGIADPDAPLPVRVRLPDGQGWIVAAYGSALAYRTAGGAWVPGGADAALLPDTATQVRTGTAVVNLPS